MTQEKCLLTSLAPELDSKRERVYGLQVAANERTSKVDPLQIMLLGLEVCNLPDIIAVRKSVLHTTSGSLEMINFLPDSIQQTPRDIFRLEHPAISYYCISGRIVRSSGTFTQLYFVGMAVI